MIGLPIKAWKKRPASRRGSRLFDDGMPSANGPGIGQRPAAPCADSLDFGQDLEMEAATAEGAAQPAKVPLPDVRRPPLSFPGSMLRVIAENQAGEIDSFRRKHKCPGPHGGTSRTSGLERGIAEEPDCAALSPPDITASPPDRGTVSLIRPSLLFRACPGFIDCGSECGTGCEQ